MDASAMSHLLLDCLVGQLGPNQVPVVRAKVSARDDASSCLLDSHTVNGIWSCASRTPIADNRLRDAQSQRQLSDATNC